MKHKRFNKLINPNFQIKFALSCLIPMGLMSGVFWIAVEAFVAKMISMGQAQGLAPHHEFFQLIQTQRIELLKILVIFTVALAVIFFIWGLLWSHKIAGPLAKLNRWLDETKDLHEAAAMPVKFRDNDMFQDIPEAVNKFVKKLKKSEQDAA